LRLLYETVNDNGFRRLTTDFEAMLNQNVFWMQIKKRLLQRQPLTYP